MIAFLPTSLIRYHYDIATRAGFTSDQIMILARGNASYIEYLRTLGVKVTEVLDAIIDSIETTSYSDVVLPKLADAAYYVTTVLPKNISYDEAGYFATIVTHSQPLEVAIQRRGKYLEPPITFPVDAMESNIISNSVVYNLPLLAWMLRNITTYNEQYTREASEYMKKSLNDIGNTQDLSKVPQDDYDYIFSKIATDSNYIKIMLVRTLNLMKTNIHYGRIVLALLKIPFTTLHSLVKSRIAELHDTQEYTMEIKKLASIPSQL